MTGDWSSLIRYALTGGADDPYVRLLKERLRAGSQLVRVDLVNAGQSPEYVVILSLQRQLSEMRIPHSEAFTNWSLDAGVRLSDEAQEVARFALLLEQRFAPLRDEMGADFFDPLLVEHVREMGPPRSARALQQVRLLLPMNLESRVKLRAAQRIEDVLVSLARALGRSLRYDEAETSRMLDDALMEWMTRHLGSENQEGALPE